MPQECNQPDVYSVGCMHAALLLLLMSQNDSSALSRQHLCGG